MSLFDLHPYQRFDLEELSNWRHHRFNNDGAEAYEAAANIIEAAFQNALRGGNLFRFWSVYFDAGREILERSRWDVLVYEILSEAFSRLTFYYFFLRKRKRASLAMNGSSVRWQVDPSLLTHARALAEQLEQNGQRVSKYYKLSDDKPLFDWVRQHVRPVIEGYVGSRAIAPHAHIRVVSTEAYRHTWDHLYREHPYGYYHWDELCYSIPLIVYLGDVTTNDGPYSYVEGSDKIKQNLTIRAFMQAISSKLLVTDDINESHKKVIAGLPRIFRGGEMVGAHLEPKLFDEHLLTRVTGVAGTAALSDGFSLVHAGGHPHFGRRQALFIAHRYPRKKLLDAWAAIAKKSWLTRMPRRKPTRANVNLNGSGDG